MGLARAHDNVVDAIALPKVIRLRPNLYAVVFVLMKLLPARFILDRAAQERRLAAGGLIAETTSGTFGLALAQLANLRGYRLVLVSDAAIDAPLQRRLEELGARVEIVRRPAAVGGLQQARLDRLAEVLASEEGSFCPRQYDNPHNPGSYALCAEILAESIGRIDRLVGTVGSGGSMCGTAAYLRTAMPDLVAVAVDSHGSVIFGQPDEPRWLRGLGNSLMPPNVDHSTFDEVHWVTAAEGFAATRELHRRHALFMGPTSGAAYLVAERRARARPDEVVAVLLPDEGYRYQSTVYDDRWLHEHELVAASLPSRPEVLARPDEWTADARDGRRWSSFPWRRRTYEQVMGRPFRPGATAGAKAAAS